jgi:RNA polymerase sigma-70 factor (ECF subfamily)
MDSECERLIALIEQGDQTARDNLLDRHREYLRNVVALRMDRRLHSRLDPSDVVQEVLLEADGKLAAYLEGRPLPFNIWLRQLALERLAGLYRRHIQTQKRSVRREEFRLSFLTEESMDQLADKLADRGSSPSSQARKADTRRRVTAALALLSESDREVLVLRYLEQLSNADIAQVLDLSLSAVKMKHLRSLQRLRDLLKDHPTEDLP